MKRAYLKSLLCWSFNLLCKLLLWVFYLLWLIDLKASVFLHENELCSDCLILQQILEDMLLLLYMSAWELILLKEQAVTFQLVTEELRVHSLSKKLISLLQLSQNQLLHRIWELLHSQKESSVREMKVAEVCLCLHCSLILLSSCIWQLLNEIKQRLLNYLLLDSVLQRCMSGLNHID